ncbi:MAG: aminotransferase class I/II-fold pyridoxal phosphate-dependent enzyme [Ardenticatenaceae bacterium]|nr:aminotransferase class I/II-fold pyridoxal phosphate-dependent enzyme [Ardenticatenaceae bacterium]MCB9446101.1 aminotransferase class I/II-fold pyridoxal phosphate-dependent enzyme [Ardenticatenaceae bacterium]
MKIAPFEIEQYFDRYEFTTPYLLCASDCETMSVAELLQMADVSLTDFADMRLGYTEAQGSQELRTAVAQTYKSVQPDHVVILTAPEEGIYLTMRALLEPGDHVIVLTPAYNSLLNLAQHVSGNVSQWEIQPTESGWQIDLAAFEQLVTPATKLIIVNFPHNPTGFLPTTDEFQTIIDIAQRHNTWLFCDEMYRGLELNGTPTLVSAVDQYQRAIVLSGLSKTHGLPGLRSGWLVVRDATLRAQLQNWKHYTTICPPAPSEFLALAALHVQDKLAARNRRLIEHNLQAANEFFGRWPKLFTWRPPQAGSVALVGLNLPSATDYCHVLAQNSGVLLLPSSYLGYGDQHVRVGFGRANFVDNLAKYEKYLLSV